MGETVISGWDVMDQSYAALRSVVAGVQEADWKAPTPCEGWTVTQVLQHVAGDERAYAQAITGTDGPDYNPFDPSGDVVEDPAAFVESALSAAAAAWATIGKDVESAPTPLPLGPLPTWVGSGAAGLDAAVHAWDIAVATGQPNPLSPSLAAELHKVAKEIVEPLRAFAFAPALPEEPDDDEVAKLLKYVGRDPHHARA